METIRKTRDSNKNRASYKNPTASAAIGKVDREIAAKRKEEAYDVIANIYAVAYMHGFLIAEPIALVDKRNNKVYAEEGYAGAKDEEV